MKTLVNPIFVLFLFQLISIIFLRRHLSKTVRAWFYALSLLVGLVAFTATPLAGKVLGTSLTPDVVDAEHAPEFIFVLGGGYFPGSLPEEDVLSVATTQRVLHGVMVWQRFPAARLVFSGAELSGVRAQNRGVQLMAELAASRGVPSAVMLLEPHSRNTREHPTEALKLPGVTPQTSIMLVTSVWHMKRAQKEFRRYFHDVQVAPMDEASLPLRRKDFVPDTDALATNTTLLREWVGMLWYGVRASLPL